MDLVVVLKIQTLHENGLIQSQVAARSAVPEGLTHPLKEGQKQGMKGQEESRSANWSPNKPSNVPAQSGSANWPPNLPEQNTGRDSGMKVAESLAHYNDPSRAKLEVPFAELGSLVGISGSQAFESVKRLTNAKLLNSERSIRYYNLFQAISAVGFYFPAEPGKLVRGVPTGYAGPPLNSVIVQSSEPPPVWIDPAGSVRGLSVEPLYKTVPFAIQTDDLLYEYLCLIDALRIGRAREINFAKDELKRRWAL